MCKEQQNLTEEEPLKWQNYNPVTVHDTVGAILLGIVSIALLVALLRALAQNRELMRQLRS